MLVTRGNNANRWRSFFTFGRRRRSLRGGGESPLKLGGVCSDRTRARRDSYRDGLNTLSRKEEEEKEIINETDIKR